MCHSIGYPGRRMTPVAPWETIFASPIGALRIAVGCLVRHKPPGLSFGTCPGTQTFVTKFWFMKWQRPTCDTFCVLCRKQSRNMMLLMPLVLHRRRGKKTAVTAAFRKVFFAPSHWFFEKHFRVDNRWTDVEPACNRHGWIWKISIDELMLSLPVTGTDEFEKYFNARKQK